MPVCQVACADIRTRKKTAAASMLEAVPMPLSPIRTAFEYAVSRTCLEHCKSGEARKANATTDLRAQRNTRTPMSYTAPARAFGHAVVIMAVAERGPIARGRQAIRSIWRPLRTCYLPSTSKFRPRGSRLLRQPKARLLRRAWRPQRALPAPLRIDQVRESWAAVAFPSGPLQG